MATPSASAVSLSSALPPLFESITRTMPLSAYAARRIRSLFKQLKGGPFDELKRAVRILARRAERARLVSRLACVSRDACELADAWALADTREAAYAQAAALLLGLDAYRVASVSIAHTKLALLVLATRGPSDAPSALAEGWESAAQTWYNFLEWMRQSAEAAEEAIEVPHSVALEEDEEAGAAEEEEEGAPA